MCLGYGSGCSKNGPREGLGTIRSDRRKISGDRLDIWDKVTASIIQTFPSRTGRLETDKLTVCPQHSVPLAGSGTLLRCLREPFTVRTKAHKIRTFVPRTAAKQKSMTV